MHIFEGNADYREKGVERAPDYDLSFNGTALVGFRFRGCKILVSREMGKWHLSISRPERYPDWDGWVYCESLQRHNEGYFESIDELVDYCLDLENDEDDFEWPEWCFACEESPPPHIDMSDIIERFIDEGYEGIEDRIQGEDELRKALDAFWEANKHLVTYYPDYTIAVKVTRPEVPKQN